MTGKTTLIKYYTKQRGNKMKRTRAIKTANQIARKAGFGRATSIIVDDDSKIIGYTRYGYRKFTTGEYVPNAYLAKFGWKNTYYQAAACEVMVNIENFY